MMMEEEEEVGKAFNFQWSGITMKFKQHWQTKGQREFVLQDISGFARSGELHAVLGSSGCGKTTLLNALASRVPVSRKFQLFGQLSLHGARARIAVIPQNDFLFAHLTVRETLQLAALFYMPNSTLQEREDKVDAVLRELQLVSVQYTNVGSASKRGVSGGERKRVAIGRELILTPKILLCDEVTSGLDSFQALSVVQSLKALAQSRIIIMTIHQPRSSIYVEFDRLTVLTEGRLVFFGRRLALEPYFESQLGFRCPVGFNVADWLLDLVSLDQRDELKQAVSRERIELLVARYGLVMGRNVSIERPFPREFELQSEEGKDGDGDGDGSEAETDGAALSETSSIQQGQEYSDAHGQNTAMRQFWKYLHITGVLYWRATIEQVRDLNTQVVKFIVLVFLAAILSLLYSKKDEAYLTSQASIQNRLGLLFFVIVNSSFGPVQDVAKVFPEEKVICGKEIASGAYSTSAYFISRFLATLPFAIFNAIVYSSIIYFSTGLALDVGKYFVFLGTIGLTLVCAQGFGLMLSAVSPSTAVATSLGAPFIIIFVLTGGFYLNSTAFPKGAGWLVYTSYVYFGFSALVINEFSGLNFTCPPGSGETSCQSTGEDVIAGLGLDGGSIFLSLGCLAILTVGFTVTAYFALLVGTDKFLFMQPPPLHEQAAGHKSVDVDVDVDP